MGAKAREENMYEVPHISFIFKEKKGFKIILKKKKGYPLGNPKNQIQLSMSG